MSKPGLSREEKLAQIRAKGAQAKAAGQREKAAAERVELLEQVKVETATKLEQLQRESVESRKRMAALASGDRVQQDWALQELQRIQNANNPAVKVGGKQ